MANSYAVTSMTVAQSANGVNTEVTITGSVNGTKVIITVPYSKIQSNLGSISGFQNFVTPLLLCAYQQMFPPTPSTLVPPSVSWSA